MKTKIEIKSFLTSSILFESECDGNTILKTLKEAVNKGADLQGADLRGAYLRGADLRGAYLRGANLGGADLVGADLQGADLQGADLQYAYLRCADLQYANLQYANLQYANLRGAYLRGADLQGANLGGANLGGKKIKTANVITGLYKYSVIPYFTECGDIRIKMGCCDRLLSEWESNFWNNNIEFPNDNSINSNLRLMAFETAKKWIEIVNQDKSQQ
jgi:uncharacterized protein YjbI with pentapeptide repeats